MAQVQVLESLRETVFSRWDFQEHFPPSVKLFANSISASELPSLIQQVREAHPAAVTNPEAPTFADLWANFSVGLALEKIKAGSGETEILMATQLAKGNMAVNFEMARILTQNGLYKRARLLQLEVQRNMLEKGYIKVPELAKLELLRAREAMGQGSYLVARQDAEFAGRLDPLCPWVPFMLMEMEFREKPPISWDLSAAWSHLTEAIRLLQYYDSQSLFIVNMSRAFRMGLAFFGAITLLVLFGKYFSRITHLWVERLPNQVEIWIRYFALALLPLSLMIGGLGYAALGLAFTMLLWKHVTNQEKTFLKVVMTGLALIPFIFMWEKTMVRHLDDTLGVHLYHRAYNRGYEAPQIAQMEAFKAKTPEDSLYRSLAYSLAYKKQGEYIKAGEFGRLAAQIEPNNPYVLLNNGNLAMVGFDYAGASTAFTEARRIAPNMVETWFNSSQAELYSNNSTRHKKYLDRAAEVDPQWVNQFLKDNDEYFPQYPATRKAMDPMLRNRLAWTAAWNSLIGLDFLGVWVSTGIYEIMGGWLLAMVGIVALLLHFRFRHYSQHSHGKDLFDCKICNRVMCRLCRKGVHCHTCFKTVSGIHDNRVKMEMVKRMRIRSAVQRVRIGAVLNALWPGTGLLFLGLGTGRFVWILVTGFFMGGLWQVNHLLMEYPSFVIGPFHWLPWLPIALFYLLFNIKLLRTPVNVGELMAASASMEKESFR